VVRLRGAFDGMAQEALVDSALLAGFLHRTTRMDGVYTRAAGQPDIVAHWNYYSVPPDDQPPPLAALELSRHALQLIRDRLWDADLAEAALTHLPEAERAALRVPPLSELQVGSVLGITYGFADNMHWHTDMAAEAGWCATLSIGAPAAFQYIPLPCDPAGRRGPAAREPKSAVTLTLLSGDVLLFHGGRLQHRVVAITPAEVGTPADNAWRCTPLGAGVARLVVQARPFGASAAHTYPALLEAGYQCHDDLLERGRTELHRATSARRRLHPEA